MIPLSDGIPRTPVAHRQRRADRCELRRLDLLRAAAPGRLAMVRLLAQEPAGDPAWAVSG
jgi:hypothetical protein